MAPFDTLAMDVAWPAGTPTCNRICNRAALSSFRTDGRTAIEIPGAKTLYTGGCSASKPPSKRLAPTPSLRLPKRLGVAGATGFVVLLVVLGVVVCTTVPSGRVEVVSVAGVPEDVVVEPGVGAVAEAGGVKRVDRAEST